MAAIVPEGAHRRRAVATIGPGWRRQAVLLGIFRRGRRIGGRVRRAEMRAGGILRLLVPEARGHDVIDWSGVMPLADRGLAMTDYEKVPLSIALFAGAVAAA